jgi:hypothetical protein
LLEERLQGLLTIDYGGRMRRSNVLMLVLWVPCILAGCDGNQSNTISSTTPAPVDMDHVTAAKQQLELGNWEAASELAYLALVELPDDLDATIIAAKAEAGRGNHRIALDLLNPADLSSHLGRQVVDLDVNLRLAVNEEWEAADALLNALGVYPQEDRWRVQAWKLLNSCGRRHEASVQASWLCRAGKASRQ